MSSKKVKTDRTYYQGVFWIFAKSVKAIHRGNFTLLGKRLLSDYNGDYCEEITDFNALTHKALWREYAPTQLEDEYYTYLPRGCVMIHDRTAFIHIPSEMNIPELIDEIIGMYAVKGLYVEVIFNHTYPGSHYDFQLK